MNALAEEKRRLRQAAAERTDALPAGYLAEAGPRIAAHIAALSAYRSAGTVLAFASTAREVDTRPLLERILSDGKALALPLCTGPGRMEARLVRDLGALRPGRYGILEPPADAPRPDPGAVGLTVVPCAACDRAGHRLGHGGGYYDRYLAAHPGPAALVCPEALIFDRIPQDPHDRAVGLIVTETGVYRSQNTQEV